MSLLISSSPSERVDWAEGSAFEFHASETDFWICPDFCSDFVHTNFFFPSASSFPLFFDPFAFDF